MMHPSGLTWERWNFPFKTPAERELIAKWLAVKDVMNTTIPF